MALSIGRPGAGWRRGIGGWAGPAPAGQWAWASLWAADLTATARRVEGRRCSALSLLMALSLRRDSAIASIQRRRPLIRRRELRRKAEVPAAQKRLLDARACAAAAPHPSRSVELEHAARGPVVQRRCSCSRHEITNPRCRYILLRTVSNIIAIYHTYSINL